MPKRRYSWEWLGDNTGNYSVKSAYHLLTSEQNPCSDSLYKNVWNKYVPSKVTAFSWRAVRNRLPTLDNLVSRGVLQGNTNSLCSGCHLAMETVSHLFFVCKLYSNMWIQLLHWVGGIGCNA